ncbi:MAG: bifunctional aspartate kinase/homoserine dehydrogenase I [Pseudomonadota bacterium]
MNWIVHKFGGSSLADAEAIARVGELLLARDDTHQAVVVSAVQGTTDALIELSSLAAGSDAEWLPALQRLREQHLNCARALDVRLEVEQTLDVSFDRLRHLLEGLQLLGSLPQEALDLISALGEQWSSILLSGWFAAQQKDALRIDAREVIRIDIGELGPIARIDESRANLERLLGDGTPGRIVMTGFCCRQANGRVATLGRDGSDFSATILAALLHAQEVHIWTDVPGVLNADPTHVPQARTTPILSYREAFELAYFGAHVLHPQTMAPILAQKIPVRIRSMQQPDEPGTRIDSSGSAEPPVKGITSIRNLALVTVEGAGLLGVPGTAERVFAALKQHRISVTMISQGSSEHSICCVLPRADAERAQSVLSTVFEREIQAGQIQRIARLHDIEALAVVGDGMAGSPGVAGRLFSALGRAGVNVRAIAQGSSERNISVAIDADQATRALRAVHAGFYLSRQTLSIGVIGPGQVGKALLAQLQATAPGLRKDQRVNLRVRALANSRHMVLADQQLDDAAFAGNLNQAEALDMQRFTEHVNAEHMPHAVIIDCTASNAVAEYYADWLAAGIHVITPNKHAGSGSASRYARLRQLTSSGAAHWRYEATVGAGLPVIQTLRDLIDSGDRVQSIEGIFSGTMAWLFNRFKPGMSFTELVREAHAAGYTEPHPADDLSGMDVARKLTILAREMGLSLDLDQIEVESLVPDGLIIDGPERCTVEQFFEQLARNDDAFEQRIRNAHKQGGQLRFTASLNESGSARVGLCTVPDAHPFAHLALTDNVVAFRTERYNENPLIVQGPGAGPQVTAAGVFSDLLRIAQSIEPGI